MAGAAAVDHHGAGSSSQGRRCGREVLHSGDSHAREVEMITHGTQAEACATSRKKWHRLQLLAALLATACFAQVNPTAYVDDVRYLSSPELKGRATPSPELEKAASYIAGRFKSFGLKPLGDKGYEQSYTV